MRACLAVPAALEYPHAALVAGLKRCGYEITLDQRADVLVTWSPWRRSKREALASIFAKSDRPVIVAENGWLSPIDETRYFQLARNGWNGEGSFPIGPPGRWRRWGIEPAPWRWSGDHVLVIGQRGLPDDPRTMPTGWFMRVPIVTRLPVIRRAPSCGAPLSLQLADAAECHVWSSNAAAWAVLAGVPVVQHGPVLMVSELASPPGVPLRRPYRGHVLERLAWAQWSETELATGEPFARLLERP